MAILTHSCFGDWNAKNRELVAETARLGGNPYRQKYLEACYKNNEKHMKKPFGDTELGHMLGKAAITLAWFSPFIAFVIFT